jgi:hypothetical protein
MRLRSTHRPIRRAILVLALAASLGGAALVATSALAGSGTATVYFDRTSCLGTQTTGATADVTYTRSGKVIDVDVTLNSGWNTGVAHGVLLFVLTPNGSCPASGQFLGTIPSGSSTAQFLAKVKGARNNHDITVVFCLGQAGPHFSTAATLSP